jgi:peroxin-14
LKASEQDRTEKLDKILADLESFVRDTKSASMRQDDETDRLRTEMKSLKDVIPRTLNANKEFADGRLREIANEVKSLKALIGQRMSSSTPSLAAGISSTSNSYLKPASSGSSTAAAPPSPSVQDASADATANTPQTNGEGPTSVQGSKQDYISSLGGRSSPFGASSTGAKAAIPAWQLAMANKSAGADSSASQTTDAGSST